MKKHSFISITLLLICLVTFMTTMTTTVNADLIGKDGKLIAKTTVKPKITLEEFKVLWEKEGKTPQGAVKCLLIAALETVKEGNKDGKKMWAMVIPKSQVKQNGEPENSHSFAMGQFARVIKGTKFRGAIAASYLGGTPENGYKYSYDNNVVIDRSNIKGNDAKIFFKSGGKGFASPVRLRRNKHGYWKIFEYSSLYTGVKPIKDGDF
ncbi:MAG: hypothetical protein K8T10_07915 [Candidatus Eremiobacteraeota bacterium]|nr:hypothetical protein [Candidatus Eremiobacteraeota bacterium]